MIKRLSLSTYKASVPEYLPNYYLLLAPEYCGKRVSLSAPEYYAGKRVSLSTTAKACVPEYSKACVPEY